MLYSRPRVRPRYLVESLGFHLLSAAECEWLALKPTVQKHGNNVPWTFCSPSGLQYLFVLSRFAIGTNATRCRMAGTTTAP